MENIFFDANPGEICAIVGRGGVGKTTLVSLIPRFYEPEDGGILIDGEDISDANLKKLRKNIGIVAQETFLFSDSIKENIRFENPDAKDEEVDADKILVLQDGKIVEIGTHKELYEKNGVYRKLYDEQFAGK